MIHLRTALFWTVCLVAVVGSLAFGQGTNINAIGQFESALPSYWTMGSAPSGATLSWATDQSVSMGRSIKITKGVTSDSAAWTSQNMVDLWSQRHTGSVDMKIGAWVKTQGVNTSPVSDDQKWWVSYSFYDSAGVLIGQTKLPIDQTVGTSTGWIADTNDVGETILPKDSWKTIIQFVGGKNATGTVWADNFILYGRAGAWAGQDWNTQLGVPTGYYYWLPPSGGNDGLLDAGFENTVLTTEAAHSGLRSLKFSLPFGRRSQDGFVGTRRYLLNGGTVGKTAAQRGPQDIASLTGVKEGDVLRLSVWLKATGLSPDSAAKYPGTWSVGFTPLFHAKIGNNDGYNPVGSNPDYTFAFPPVTSFDWTQYTLDITVPTGVSAQALEVRLHVYSQFTGTIYWDDLTVQVIGTTTGVKTAKDGVPKTFELAENYPNPFNPSTTIRYGVPLDGPVSLIVYNILGQQVRTLLNAPIAAGRYSITWDGRDEAGRVLSSGVYFYRLQSSATALVKKMMLLK